MRLGERDRGEHSVLAGQPRQVVLALRIAPESQQRTNREHRRLERRRQPGAAPRQLLGDQRARHGVRAAAAVLCGDRIRGEAGPRGLREQAGRILLTLVPLARDRTQLALRELVGGPLQLPLLGRQLEDDQKVKSSMPPLTFSPTPVMYDGEVGAEECDRVRDRPAAHRPAASRSA